MKVISTTYFYREYPKSCVQEAVSLTEVLGVYAVIVCRKQIGVFDREDVSVGFSTTDYPAAVKKYQQLGGVLN